MNKKTISLQSVPVVLGLLVGGITTSAQAVPSYARQTGQDCAACHIGSFGPQLTPYGIKFKMGGYTDSDGKEGHIPLSAMLVGSHTHTSTDMTTDVAPDFGRNNNTSLQQASLFVAGRFTENIGVFSQVTYAEPGKKVAMDNVDLRLTKALQLGDKDTVLGLSINNNPSVTDPFNTVPAWRFPYMSSGLAPGSATTPFLDGGLGGTVIGASAYGFYDNNWYAELGLYRSLSNSFLEDVNVGAQESRVKGVAPYWRLAYFKDMRKQAFSLGIFGLSAHMQPDGDPATDQYRDVGIDGSYQFLGTREHIVALNGSYINEHRNLDAAFANGGSDTVGSRLHRTDLSVSYHYEKTYGVTLGLFNINGPSNQSLYNNGEADSGSANGSPDTNGFTIQADWTPFGKEKSWYAPWANVRIGLQFTGYEKFNGARHDYDGFGRDASDNNTIYSFIWFAL